MTSLIANRRTVWLIGVLGLAASIVTRSYGQGLQPPIDYPRQPPCLEYTFQTQLTPLTPHQKFCYFVKHRAITASGIFGSAFTAAYAQLTDSPSEWGGGTAGYSRRFGTRFAQGLTKSSTEALFGIIDGEDPRLHPSAEAGTMFSQPSRIMPRLGKALLRTVWTPRDAYTDGRARRDSLSYSRIAGSFASGFIGMAWTPDRQNTPGQAFGRTGTALGGYAASCVWTEFQPDVISLIGRMIGQHKSNAKQSVRDGS
jgi:hypothetical protein